MARNSYSAGKRQRERKKERKKREKAAAREQKRSESTGGIPVTTVEEIQGGLLSKEEVLKNAIGGGTRNDRSVKDSGGSTRLFVGGLHWDITSEQLQSTFEKIGPVSDAFVVTDRDTGDSRGFGFVTMSRKDAATAIEDLDGEEVEGRTVVVRPATDRK